MPGIQRAYTSYDVYRDYDEDEVLDSYPIEGVFTPQPLDGRLTPQTPHNGLQRTARATSCRPGSRTLSPSRPKSRMNVGVQDFYNTPPIHTEKKIRPVPSETQYNYAIPNQGGRPTSPVQRLLERSHTQPYMSLQGSLPGSDMDPITRQYYHRLWKSQEQANNLNLNRYGRAGGVWRHVRACIANTGSQLAFIDGTVKEEDNVYFPPWNKGTAPQATYTAYRPTIPSYGGGVPQTRKVLAPRSATYMNKFNSHAKGGFKYWYQEPKPIDWRQKDFISLNEISKHLK
ncbi:uncharacterized protein LOC128209028 isoform X4 [Mya arenaria]|uniref:uncharacterized protein LOC128209028 isoform X4 n=1 Tax=Mya arenaria TaxID=6604 RepID=UPI0022E7C90E|nr:uncharacterized protein LOC128209028 isoform X4 [Mya arenaria]